MLFISKFTCLASILNMSHVPNTDTIANIYQFLVSFISTSIPDGKILRSIYVHFSRGMASLVYLSKSASGSSADTSSLWYLFLLRPRFLLNPCLHPPCLTMPPLPRPLLHHKSAYKLIKMRSIKPN
ncbi:hypothetical protein Droror1_Dr00012906 [Drosera rotundifolia]